MQVKKNQAWSIGNLFGWHGAGGHSLSLMQIQNFRTFWPTFTNNEELRMIGMSGRSCRSKFQKIIKRETASMEVVKTTNIGANPWDWEKYSAASTCDGPSKDNGASPQHSQNNLTSPFGHCSSWPVQSNEWKTGKQHKAADDCGLVATTLAPCFICFLAHADEWHRKTGFIPFYTLPAFQPMFVPLRISMC